MLTRTSGDMSTVQEKRDRNVSGLIRFATTQLAVAGWLAMTISSADAAYDLNHYPYSYLDSTDFRVCASRLLSVKISPDVAATTCSGALRPRSISSCVVDIKRRTTVAAEDALNTCQQARRPEELASCVVGISRNSQRKADPAALNYCGRTLLPVRFGDCVVGLRRASKLDPLQAMNSCINATDRLLDLSPTFVPQNGTPSIPYQLPNLPQNGTLPNQSITSPTGPQNGTLPGGPAVPPTGPAYPGAPSPRAGNPGGG